MHGRLCRLTLASLLLALASPLAHAAVTRVDVASRTDVAYGYEKIAGTIHFSVDPSDPHNAEIVDLNRAPRNAQGKVEFSSDFVILKPKRGTGSGVALIDIVNRGNVTVKRFNRVTSAGAGSDDPAAREPATEDLGDGFLMKMGVTVVEVGWEFDVTRKNGLRITLPVVTENGKPAGGMVTAAVIPTHGGATSEVGDLAGYRPSDPNAADSVLRVRDNLFAGAQEIPRAQWQLKGNEVTLNGGFTPGKVYELTYRSAGLPIGGLGFAAVRDTGAWVKHDPNALASARYLYTFGSSQSGRFLRTFLYQGFNTDEHGQQVFDGVMAHIAGSSRLVLNRRASTPTTLGMFTATAYPFADRAVPDPVSGASEGLLDNPRARADQPKIMYTNTDVEYWGGGRVAALVHTSPDGTKDLDLPDNVRVYFLAGSQHSPARFPPKVDNGQQIGNPTDYWWTLRALFVSMDRWVREGTLPPASQYPRLSTHTLVEAADIAFPTIPHVQSPNRLTAGVRIANQFITGGAGAGTPLPLLVPQVDADGNDTSGIRMPEQAVPLGTFTGWNFRNETIGAPDQLYPLLGSYVPFALTKADREASHDPRLSIEERYPTHEAYTTKVAAQAQALVKGGYLLEADVPAILQRAEEHWTWAHQRGAGK